MATFTLIKYNRYINLYFSILFVISIQRSDNQAGNRCVYLRKRAALQSLIFDAPTLSYQSLAIKYSYGNYSMLHQNTFTKNWFECICHTFPLQNLNLYFNLQSIKIDIRKNIFACLFSVHNAISLSRHEQVFH